MSWPSFVRAVRRVTGFFALRRGGVETGIADLEHVSGPGGTRRHAPVMALRSGDLAAVGANFGRASEWVNNVLATGHARMQLNGDRLYLSEPRLVTVEEAQDLFSPEFALALRDELKTPQWVIFRVDDWT